MKLRKLGSKGFAHIMAFLIVVVGVAIIGTAYLVASHADSCSTTSGSLTSGSITSGSTTSCSTGNAILSLSPTSGSETLGSTIVVIINESSGSTTVNAVQADLVYNTSQLQYVSSQCSSPFSLTGNATGGSGTTNLACASANTSLTGVQNVGTVTFKVLSTGNSTVSTNSNSEILQTSNQQNIWNRSTSSAVFSLSAGTATLALSSVSGGRQVGTTLVVKIAANSGTVPVNAVQADLLYNKAQLQYVSTATASPYNICPQNTGGSGQTELACATTGSLTNSHLVAAITFNVIGTGTSTVSLNSNSEILQTSNQQNIWNGNTTGTTLSLGPGKLV